MILPRPCVVSLNSWATRLLQLEDLLHYRMRLACCGRLVDLTMRAIQSGRWTIGYTCQCARTLGLACFAFGMEPN